MARVQAGANPPFLPGDTNLLPALLTVLESGPDHACSNNEAIAAYKKLRADERIDFLRDEPFGLDRQWLEYSGGPRPSPKRWMDAYLGALARCAQIPFAIMDQGFTQFPGLKLTLLKA